MNHHVKPLTLIKLTYYGTPSPEIHEATKMVTLEIDGREITVAEGTSIMNAAMQLGIQIPKLCAVNNFRRRLHYWPQHLRVEVNVPRCQGYRY